MVKCAYIVVLYDLTVCFYHSCFVFVYYGGTLINVGLESVFFAVLTFMGLHSLIVWLT